MTHEDLAAQVPVSISAGHLIVLWDVLTNKLAGSKFIDTLSQEEQTAVWAAQDLFEQALDRNGISTNSTVLEILVVHGIVPESSVAARGGRWARVWRVGLRNTGK